MKIKVCGVNDLEQLKELNELEIDYTGMIFYPASQRSVLNNLKAEDVKNLSLSGQKVGVFVNDPVEEVLRQVSEYGLDLVQLHGDETPVFCNQVSDHVQLIKAFRVGQTQTEIDRMVKEFEEVCDYYLFDKGSMGIYGGTGQKFDWQLLKDSEINKPFFLSGGIEYEDLDALKNFHHPFLYGIDINSRFELSPGIKDMQKVTKFVQAIHAFQNTMKL